MRERVLAIVTIIAQYMLEDRELPADGDIVSALLADGFTDEEIAAAFSWMEQLSLPPTSAHPQPLTIPSQRIFTADEKRRLSLGARGFLLRLRAAGLVEESIVEEIIERALDGADDEIELDDLKPMAALVLFARAQGDWYRTVEYLLEDNWSNFYH